MLRLLGILSLGHLLFGGRRHHFRRGILLGALLGYLANMDFDADRVAEDVREKAGKVERAAREAVHAAKREFRKAEFDRRAEEIHEKAEARKAERKARMDALLAEVEARKAARKAHSEQVVHALPTSGTNEAKVIRELAEDLEKDARTAAMAADVPTIDFPEDDEKYDSSRKYGYAR